MEMKKRIIKGCAWALALVTAVSVLALRQDTAYGAVAVDPATPRSITFNLAKNVGGTYDELTNLAIPIQYHKVADMNIPTGTYNDTLQVQYNVVEKKANQGYEIILKGEPGFDPETAKTAKLGDVAFDTGESKDATYAWEALAKKAKADLGDAKGTEVVKPAGSSSVTVNFGSDTTPGMYLIFVDDDVVKSANYVYNFKPFLISVPTNNYVPGAVDANDAWVYDVEVGLKPEQKERYASLRITKALDNFNATLGGAMFVFDVTATVEKTGAAGETVTETVYSDVVQLSFDGPGSKSVLIGPEGKTGVNVIGKIPAGSKVTVTERHKGSAYKVVGNDVWSVEGITASQEGTGNPDATAAFENDYNGGINGGAGVVNHFEYSEEDKNWKDPVQEFVSGQTEGGNPQ